MTQEEKKEIIKNGVLLMHTDGNWDYYLYRGQTYSIAKDQQCKSCWFGGIDHFRKNYFRCLYQFGHSYGLLTKKGKEIIKL